ncbi:MAG: hypothetical protein KME45_10630 [Stenomitos rutilans HA7619-LM2]|jgi:hypothetical protein|nr:hypothetical protein [Stenomitos rutilans HA7619-LM2]
MLKWLGTTMVVGAVMCLGVSANAQSCRLLRVVEGKGAYSVQKKVSAASTPVSPSNWNTDFAVPGGQRYSSYAATIRAKNKGNYSIQMNLKYANGTSDKVYDSKVSLKDNEAVNLSGSPRLNTEPYQVNVVVGGIPVTGNSYTVSASGCR